MTRNLLGFLVVLLLMNWGAASSQALADSHIFDPDQPPADGMGTVYGKLQIRPHKDYVKKAKEKAKNAGPGAVDQYGTPLRDDGKLSFSEKMVNYNLIKVFTILLNPAAKLDAEEYEVVVEEDGMKPGALAVNKGDVIEIENDSGKDLTFFLADTNSNDIQEFPLIKSGDSAKIKVELVGDLELTADEDERFTASVLSRQGLQSRKARSGNLYSFRNLAPGQYDLLFWYWRLGYLKKTIIIEAGKNLEINGTLSVDTVVK
ncbi:MAG: hypothetical protein O3A85_06950 [Proteobacteria bacterium]|nr:hypothetical protein [Pseudomonadota bacterium]